MALWGKTFIKPLLVAVERPSKLLSIYQVLRSPFSPLLHWFGIENLDTISTPIFLFGVGLLTIYLIYRRFTVISGSLLAFILTLILYKVGHQQFHVSLYLLLIYWLIIDAPHNKLTTIASAIYILFMNVADIGYAYTTFIGKWEIVRNLIGAPTFIILTFLFLAVFYEAKGKIMDGQQTNELA
jgi:hypothetical protein